MVLDRIGGGTFLVAALLLFCAGCADQMLLAPSQQAIASPKASKQAVALADGGTLEIWTARTSLADDVGPRAFVLRFCGNGERAENAVQTERQLWGEFPVEIWAVNYPGFGGSSGPSQLRLLAPCGLAAYDVLAKHAAGHPILLSGLSMGTVVALYVAVNRPVDGLLLRSPVPVRDVILGRYGWWNLWLFAGPVAAGFPSELDSEKNAQRITVPAVFIITGNDELVPRTYQRRITGAYAGKKKVFVAEQAHHNTPLTERELQKLQEDLRWLFPKHTTATTRPASRGHPSSATTP